MTRKRNKKTCKNSTKNDGKQIVKPKGIANNCIQYNWKQIRELAPNYLGPIMKKFAADATFRGLTKDVLLLLCDYLSLSAIYRIACTCRSMYFFMMSDWVLSKKNMKKISNGEFGIHNIVKKKCQEHFERVRHKNSPEYKLTTSDKYYDYDYDSDDYRDTSICYDPYTYYGSSTYYYN